MRWSEQEMKYAVVLSSKTGNTAILAEKIKEILSAHECSYFGNADEAPSDVDIIFVGFWTDKGTCDEGIMNYLSRLENKKVFLFGTAGFGGGSAYFEQILERVKKNISKTNTIVDTFMCQGKMPISIRKRYEAILQQNPEDKKMIKMIENFDNALLHPNEDDLAHLATKLLEVLK